MADIFEEVEADLRAERIRGLLQHYGRFVGLALVVVGIGLVAWQGLVWWKARQERVVAASYFSAVQAAGGVSPAGAGTGGDARAEEAFARLAGTNTPAGYRTLSRLRAAALAAGNGQLNLALKLWQEVADDHESGPLFAGLARLLWVTHQINGVKPGTDVQPLTAELEPLLASANPWRPLAEEAAALISIAQGNRAAAKKALAALSGDPTAPQGVRARAGALVVQLSR